MTVSSFLSCYVPEGCWFCAGGGSVLRTLSLKQESQCLLHLVWLSVGREKALMIKVTELGINSTAGHFRVPKLGAKYFPHLPSFNS